MNSPKLFLLIAAFKVCTKMKNITVLQNVDETSTTHGHHLLQMDQTLKL